MDVEDTIEQITGLVRALVAEAERRGEQRALDRIRAAIGVADEPAVASSPPGPVRQLHSEAATGDAGATRRRAPKGSVGNLVDRALADGGGLTLLEIGATARDDVERMIAGTSIRAHLKKGESAGLYREEAGRWYAVGSTAEEPEESTESVTDDAPADLWSTDDAET